MNVVHVDLGSRSYPIHIEQNGLAKLGPILKKLFSTNRIQTNHAVIVSDENVAGIYLTQVADQLELVHDKVDSVIVPAGEKTKSVAQLESLWQKLVELESDRKSTVYALGGGVVGDLAGFLAASFARGISFVQIPTSLLAQVDSSVGGKVGINLPAAKNIVGAFWQPECVVIDPNVLLTLEEREYVSGLAEVVKYGVIMDTPFFNYLENSIANIKAKDPSTLSHIIKRCCELKAAIVKADEHETSGRRAILNYGHTYGHAIESVFGYGRFTHGEAISIGMNCAARLAIQLGLAEQELLTRQTALLTELGLPVECPADKHVELNKAMKRDKKVQNGVLMLVLPIKIGHVELVPSPGETPILESLHCE